MTKNTTFVSRALCSVDEQNPAFRRGMRGAYINVVCNSESVENAVSSITSELKENTLSVRGFDYIFDLNYLDREPSEYEKELIQRLSAYPIQFENVHYFPLD